MEKATECYNAALTIDEAVPMAHFKLGQVAQRQGQLDLAIEKSFRISPQPEELKQGFFKRLSRLLS